MAARASGLLPILALLVLASGCRDNREPDPAKRIAAGWERFAQGDFTLALDEFEAAAESLPEGPDRIRALHGLATTWNLRRPGEDAGKAAAFYRQVIEADPEGDLAAWSALALARQPLLQPGAAVTPPDPAALEKAYQEVIDRYPAHEAAEQAFLLQQGLRIEAIDPGKARQALAALDDFIKAHPGTTYASTAWRLVAQACEILNLPERRLEATFREWKTTEVDPLNPGQELAMTYWRIATLAEFELGDFALAREYYRKLIAEYPTEIRVFLAKRELERMDALEARLRAEAAAGKGAP